MKVSVHASSRILMLICESAWTQKRQVTSRMGSTHSKRGYRSLERAIENRTKLFCPLVFLVALDPGDDLEGIITAEASLELPDDSIRAACELDPAHSHSQGTAGGGKENHSHAQTDLIYSQ